MRRCFNRIDGPGPSGQMYVPACSAAPRQGRISRFGGQEKGMPGETRYARSGRFHIAYQVLGRGAFDLVATPGFVSHLEHQWEEPRFARYLERMASFSRLIIFDKRGTGLSDRDVGDPTLEARMDDIRAVMDAAGSKQAAILGISEGGPMAAMFAATYPERTRALVLYGASAEFSSWVPTPERYRAVEDYIDRPGAVAGSCTLFRPISRRTPAIEPGGNATNGWRPAP